VYRVKKVQESHAEGAYKTALNIVARADNTEAALRRKLRDRGYQEDHIEEALALLMKEGLLNDIRHFERKAVYYADVCLYGKGRIRLELIKKGFSRSLIDERLDEVLEGIDFCENACRLALKKKMSPPETKQDVMKIAASLQRYGYSASEIRFAIEKLRTE